MAVKPLPVHGADISHYQDGHLDLRGARRRGLRFLYHKATEGSSYVDPNFARRRAEARKAKLPFGGYHFARPTRTNARAEALHFLKVADPKPGDLRPALDLEVTGGLTTSQLRSWAHTFVETIEDAIGVKPVVYGPYDLGDAVKGCLLWRPRYNNTNTPPTSRWDIWQFSNGVYGVPHGVRGIGNVDLNTMRKGLRLRSMLIPKPRRHRKPKAVRIRVMHASLQFSISDKATTADLEKIFGYARKHDVKWITGTEAGPGAGNTSHELRRIGAEYGYDVWVPSLGKRSVADGGTTDCWIAVAHSFKLGVLETGFVPAIPGSRALYKEAGIDPESFPRWGTKGLVTVAFDSDLGRINIGAAHYLTGARSPKHSTEKGIDHWKWNEKLAAVIDAWVTRVAKGRALAFYGGDQNMADQRNAQPQGDTFMGGHMVSIGDELKKWPNTGHGPIDVIASYPADGRVSAVSWDAMNDKEFPLTQDHFVEVAEYDVKPL